jgi:uncharacterized SAM-binding protein YcdF (DUF218 family)
MAYKYHAIIVLANLMDRDGLLNAESRGRVDTAVQAYRDKLAPVVVCCGWAYRDDCPIAIADAMVEYARGRAVAIPERRPRDTVGDAAFTYEFANPVVVTSAYHAARAAEIFSFARGRTIDVISAPSADTPELRASEARSLEAFHRTFAGVRPGDRTGFVSRLQDAHPFYNGEVYPRLWTG